MHRAQPRRDTTVTGMTETAPRAHSARTAVLRRWPTALALAGAAVLLAGPGDGTELDFMLLVIGYTYLATAVVGRRRATWPLLAAVSVAVLALDAAGLTQVAVVLVVVGALVLAGLAAGTLRGPGPGWAQVPAAVALGLAGVLAPTVDPRAGGLTVAVALIAHAGWDAVHWWADRVVARTFAEWCAVLDLTVGVGLLVAL